MAKSPGSRMGSTPIQRHVYKTKWHIDSSIRLNSDHRPIVNELLEENKKPEQRWDLRKTDWTNGKAKTNDVYNDFVLKTVNLSPNETCDYYCEQILALAEKEIAKKTICGHSKDFMNEELKRLLDKAKKTRKNMI